MKNIIKTDDYLLIVSDEEIKEGDWFTDDNNSLKRSYKLSHVQFANPKKIISHLSLNNSPILEGVDLLPPLEDEVEKLVKEHWEDDKELNNPSSFKAGYNKAKEKYAQLIEKQISDFTHDLRESTSNYIKQNCEGALFGLKRLKQSLQQPKYPIGFECEMEIIGITDDGHNAILEPKTTNNSQGQTVLEGKYIYGE
jgi:hypothetical protein